MSTFKDQLFQEYATKGLDRLRSELRNKYKPKKENRFDYKNITYEIGAIKTSREGLGFEISSKIPLELLSSNISKKKYFNYVKDIMFKKDKTPLTVNMENIVTTLSENEKKERDYVKLTYVYSEDELYNSDEIIKNVERLKKKPADIPAISGVTTIFGKLVLVSIEETIYKNAKENINSFIDANEEARKKYCS